MQAYLKHCLNYVVEHCREDLEFFAQQNDRTLVQRLQVLSPPPPTMLLYMVQSSAWKAYRDGAIQSSVYDITPCVHQIIGVFVASLAASRHNCCLCKRGLLNMHTTAVKITVADDTSQKGQVIWLSSS